MNDSTRTPRALVPIRMLAAVAVALMAVGLLATSAAAAPPVKERTEVTVAYAYGGDCVAGADDTTVCTGWSVYVSDSDAYNEVCYSTYTDVYAADGSPTFSTQEFGCAPLPTGALTVDRELSTATLAPVSVTITSTVCDGAGNCTDLSREVTVSGTWTGDGELTRFKHRSSTNAAGCKTMDMSQGVYRQATATITVDGQVLETDYAELTRARSAFKRIGCT